MKDLRPVEIADNKTGKITKAFFHGWACLMQHAEAICESPSGYVKTYIVTDYTIRFVDRPEVDDNLPF